MTDPRPPGQAPDDSRRLRVQNDALARLAEQYWQEMWRLRGERDELLGSRSFRFGQAIAEALRQPWRLPGLPWRLWRIARGAGQVAGLADRVPVPSLRLPAAGAERSFRLAAVVDEFTALGLQGECELLLVTPDTSAEELRDFRPDLLLVESAWSGHRGSWRDLLAPPSQRLLELLRRCERLGVPTVFWNKEDPTHFEHFLETGCFFDHLLSTDADSIPGYLERTGRPDVGVMEFACQPRLHHPVDAGSREQAFMFAGSYYAEYPERVADFDRLMDCIPEGVPVHIYDRNHGCGNPEFEFPERYRPLIRGKLSADEVNGAYRRYAWAINLNTITDSPTMLSRRVLELLACNTLVLSNASRAMEAAFGDAVLVNPAPETLGALLADPLAQARRRLRGLRAVMRDHTWAHRVAQLRRLVDASAPAAPSLPAPTVYARAVDREGATRLLAEFAAQSCPGARLHLVAPPPLREGISLPDGAAWLGEDEAEHMPVATADGPVMVWSQDDAHGPHLLLDLALATRYWPAKAVGKPAAAEDAYRSCGMLPLRGTLVFDEALLPARTVAGLIAALPDARLEGEGLLYVDPFNHRAGARGQLPADASEHD